MISPASFAGDKKVGKWLSARIEKKIVSYFTPKIPQGLETYHLTLLTIPWTIIVVLAGYQAQFDIRWLWLSSFMIVLQYVTDLFDGAVGRLRGTGLIKWGYYMDHILDYTFLCSLLIGYFFLFPTNLIYSLFFLLALFGGFMVNSFLSFAATNEFRISYLGIGPTEVRLGFIVANTMIILFGKTYIQSVQPYVLALAFIGLLYTIYRTQDKIWDLDMKSKQSESFSRTLHFESKKPSSLKDSSSQ